MREQFEDAYRALYPTACSLDSGKFSRDALGEYGQTIVQVAWNLYQAAQGAVKPAQNLTIEAAHDLGTKGAEPSEAERLLFEAWMRGHNWQVEGEWNGRSYTHIGERSGMLHGGAMNTRRLWAAWRDRAALGAQQTAEPWVPVTESLLNSQEPWLYEPMWIALKDRKVVSGKYEWRQGRNPDRFYADDSGDFWAFDASHVMPIKPPSSPAGDDLIPQDALFVCGQMGAHVTKVYAQKPAEPWPVRGVRVDGDKVIIAVKGGNDASRWLCGEVLAKHTAQPDPEPAEPMCFLQDTRSYVGNCPMWWKHGGGYTTRVDEAQRFTVEAALRQSRSRDTDVAWLCSDIEPLARPTIDHQEMRDIKPVPVAEHKKPDDTEGGAV